MKSGEYTHFYTKSEILICRNINILWENINRHFGDNPETIFLSIPLGLQKKKIREEKGPLVSLPQAIKIS